jgi:class 3 adenylate cyclase
VSKDDFVQTDSTAKAIAVVAARGERIAGLIRVAILFLALVQYLVFLGLENALQVEISQTVVVGNMLVFLVVSVGMLRALVHRDPSGRFLLLSVGIDAAACLLVVAPTALWPKDGYEGLLDLPSIGFFLVAIFLSGFRLNPRLSLFSMVLNLAGVCVVLSLDASHGLGWGDDGGQQIVVVFILLVSAGILAASMASQSRRLAHAAGVAAVEKDRARSQLGVYVPEEVVDLALEKGAFGLTGAERHLAVLFVDLRGFTKLCENKAPELVVAELNAWFNEIVPVVQEERGIVDKYIGDCVMAVFGMVETQGDEATRALRTAASIVERMTVFNSKRKAEGLSELGYGVGVHYGVGIVGSMGAAGRLQYTVIGDVVNRASRLEGATKDTEGTVLVSQALYDQAVLESGEALPVVNAYPPVVLRGINEPVKVVSLG